MLSHLEVLKEGTILDLFEEIRAKDYIQNPNLKFIKRVEPPKIVYEKLIVEEPYELQLSPLAQYFLAPFILIDSNGILDIPVMHNFIHDKVIREIAPHFNEISKVTSDNQVKLRLQNIRESSKTHFLNVFNNHRLNAIVNDIYGKGNTGWGGNFTIREYKVNLEAIIKSVEHDILPLWDFFKDSFVLNTGYFVLIPSEWVFDESFKDRIAVRAFASVCNSMTITVNTENNTISSILID